MTASESEIAGNNESSDTTDEEQIDWEPAARSLLTQRADRVEQRVRDALRPLQRLDDTGLSVPRGAAGDLRSATIAIDELTSAVEQVDPDVATDREPTAPTLSDEQREELLQLAETLTQPGGPLLDERDDETAQVVERMASLID